MSPVSDDQLLAAREDVAQAFALFYRRHSKPLLAFIAARTTDRQSALDLTAEVFCAAFIARHRYRPDAGPARAWLFGIARHKLADHHQRRAREHAARQKLGMRQLHYTDAALEEVEQLIDIAQATDRYGLTEHEHQAVVAHVVHDVPYGELARWTGQTQATVRKRVSRGLRKLVQVRAAP